MWMEILKEGKFKDANGIEREFTAEQLEAIASQYNQSLTKDKTKQAPIVIGHPEADSPAHGWVESLSRYGKKLLAKVKEVSQDLIDDVKLGKYKNVSVSLYPDLSLRHIGVLGGARPAVVGLEHISFSEEPQVNTITNESKTEKEREAEIIAKYEKQISDLQSQVEILNKYDLERHVANFCEELKTKAFIGIDSEDIIELKECFVNMLAIEQKESKSINFSEAESNSSVLRAITILSKIKTSSNLEPLKLNRKTKPQKQNQTFDFSENPRLQKHERALEYMQSNSGVSYEEAISKVD